MSHDDPVFFEKDGALDHGRRFFGGDLLARQDDGEPWIDVAQRIAVDRYAQRTLFEPPTAVAPPEQMSIDDA